MERNEVVALFKKYNKSESLYHHALCVESVMRHFAKLKGEDENYWGNVGFLHDVDYEMYPEQHCTKCVEILKEINADDEFIHSVACHGWGICSDIKPEKYMEKVLYTIDELTGLVYATALLRPTHMEGMSVKSVKKKWKSPTFASGVNRDTITEGAAMLGMELPELIKNTIDAMSSISDQIGF